MLRFDRGLVARILALVNRWGAADPPEDPLTATREPKWRNPGGRSSSASVPEPAPEQLVTASARDRHI